LSGPFRYPQVDAPQAVAAASASAGDDAGDNDADAGYLSDSEIVQERRVKVASALDAEAAEKAREKISNNHILSRFHKYQMLDCLKFSLN
jgi:hypothetical protein